MLSPWNLNLYLLPDDFASAFLAVDILAKYFANVILVVAWWILAKMALPYRSQSEYIVFEIYIKVKVKTLI